MGKSLPDGIAASEALIITAATTCPIEVDTVTVWLEGEASVELTKGPQAGNTITWTGTYPIPASKPNKDAYDFYAYADIANGNAITVTQKVNVDTPIDLIGFINDRSADAEIYADQDNTFKCYTSKYVSTVELTFKGMTYSSDVGEINVIGNNGTTKIWEMKLTVPSVDVTAGETGAAAFTAILPSGLSQTVNVNYKVVAIKLENLRIVNIGDYNWEDTFTYVNGKHKPLRQNGISVKDMPIDVNKKARGIKLGYAVTFKMDSIGLHKPDAAIDITANYFALDRRNQLHPVDIYVEEENGDYIKLEDGAYYTLSKSLRLDADNRHVYEADPSKTNCNTWEFSIYLPYLAKVVKRGESLDLYNDNTFDYRLIVALDILGKQHSGGTVYDYTVRETEWGTDDGSVYGSSFPTASDLLGKGINHGEVFWYNLYENLLDDIQLDRRW